MSEYFIVEKVNFEPATMKSNFEPATMKSSLSAKLKSNWHLSWALVSNEEELLIKLVAQLIS